MIWDSIVLKDQESLLCACLDTTLTLGNNHSVNFAPQELIVLLKTQKKSVSSEIIVRDRIS